jgi:response regulator RpfG family c-di-GMP phosphodiesterase
MTERILCVDDDPNVLHAYQRALRKQFHIEIALGGEEALGAVIHEGPYAVVVSDMRMPGMNGVELLKKVKEHAEDTVRMMLTGNADQQTALDAVNEGHIFRFMTKPCPPEAFGKALAAGLAQYRLIRGERELLSKTFSACVKVLTDVLSAVNPAAFGRATRVRQLVRQICRELDLKGWQFEVAAMLSQVGCVGIPAEVLAKAYEGRELKAAERKLFEAYPQASQELIANIPRLEEVAEIIAYQQQHYDGGGFPGDGKHGDRIPLGSRILKVALDYDSLTSIGSGKETALAEMNDRPGRYDPAVLAALSRVLAITNLHVVRRIRMTALVDGLTLAEDIRTASGTLICAKGQEITRAIRLRLRNSWTNLGIPSAIKVFMPLDLAGRFADPDAGPDSTGTEDER